MPSPRSFERLRHWSLRSIGALSRVHNLHLPIFGEICFRALRLAEMCAIAPNVKGGCDSSMDNTNSIEFQLKLSKALISLDRNDRRGRSKAHLMSENQFQLSPSCRLFWSFLCFACKRRNATSIVWTSPFTFMLSFRFLKCTVVFITSNGHHCIFPLLQIIGGGEQNCSISLFNPFCVWSHLSLI